MSEVEPPFPGNEKFSTDRGLAIENRHRSPHPCGDFRRPETRRSSTNNGNVDLFHSDKFQSGEILGVDQADRFALGVDHHDVIDALLADLLHRLHR